MTFRFLRHALDDPTGLEAFIQEAEAAGRRLRVKFGIDPTAPDLHLGHLVPLRALRELQDRGHVAVLVMGDFTAQIGDPTGRNATRPPLSAAEAEANTQQILAQLGQDKDSGRALLGFTQPDPWREGHSPVPSLSDYDQRGEVWNNSQWLRRLDLPDIIQLASGVTVNQMLAKDDFSTRHRTGAPISLHEFIYPLLQGYDSFYINADIEIGGSDQLFNMNMGRDVMRRRGLEPQRLLRLPILPGLDGAQKMSKSLGNAVGLAEDPFTAFQKLQALPDHLHRVYARLVLGVGLGDLTPDPTNSRGRQLAIANAIITMLHGPEVAERVRRDASLIAGGDTEGVQAVTPATLPAGGYPMLLAVVMREAGITSTSSQAQRLITGGGIRVDGERITDPRACVMGPDHYDGRILQVGRGRAYRLTATR
jgi:tyrosyl-tRNA synthetase